MPGEKCPAVVARIVRGSDDERESMSSSATHALAMPSNFKPPSRSACGGFSCNTHRY
jgi:hypothetical protein